MKTDEVEIRGFSDGDESAINEAFNRARKNRRSLDEWSWRFPASKAGRAITLGLRGGRIAAHCGGAPVSLRAGGREQPAVAVRDLFSMDGDAKGGPTPSVLTQTVRAFLSRARDSGRMVLAIDSEDGELAKAGTGPDEWTPLDARLEALSREHRRSSPKRRLLYRAELARDWEPRLDDLWRRARKAYPLAVVRDAALALGQRAGHPRLRFHRFLVFPRFSRVAVAWVVFESGGGICRWMDLVWDHRHPGALEMAAHLSARYCIQMGVHVEKIMFGGDPQAVERLLSLGFAEDPEQDLGVDAFVAGPAEGLDGPDCPIYLTELDLDRF